MPLPLPELVARDTLSLPVAGLLAALVRAGVSLAVVAGPSGVGKTTLLTSLLPWVPPGNRRHYLRGQYESFAFLTAPEATLGSTTLLVNEISPHLPGYLWGEGVGRLLEARRRGCQVLTTAHADDALAFAALLAGPPLRLAADLVAGIDVVAALRLGRGGTAVRREIAGLWAMAPGRPGEARLAWLCAGNAAMAEVEAGLAAARAIGAAVGSVSGTAAAVAAAAVAEDRGAIAPRGDGPAGGAGRRESRPPPRAGSGGRAGSP